jgi:hypothetical protein
MQKRNYPVKYALLPITERKMSNSGREYSETACFIVAKTYVVEEYKRIPEEGEIITTYRVCFPHVALEDRVNHFRKTPDSDLARDNEMVVSNLYDTYEEAKAYKDERNLLVSPETLEKYQLVEDEIQALTVDLEVEPTEVLEASNGFSKA